MRIAVLGGGRSPERAASLDSAAAVRDGLERAGHDVLAVEIASSGRWHGEDGPIALEPGCGFPGVDVVFPMLHGPNGEDGTIQGLLESLTVPYVGAGILASALAIDKLMFKELLGAHGLPQVRYRGMNSRAFEADPVRACATLAALRLPLFVKPRGVGSSLGVSRVCDAQELAPALALAFAHDQVALVEEAAPGIEVECAVLGNEDPIISRPGELVVVASASGWRDARAKARRGSVQLVVPARITDRAAELVEELTRRVFALTRCAGLARVDFFVDGETVLVNEINTMPGLKPTSIFPLMLAHGGIGYETLLERLLELALERHTIGPAPAAQASAPWVGLG